MSHSTPMAEDLRQELGVVATPLHFHLKRRSQGKGSEGVRHPETHTKHTESASHRHSESPRRGAYRHPEASRSTQNSTRGYLLQ